MTTLAEAVTHFSGLGYQGCFRAEEAGLREVFTRKLYTPDRLWIEDVFRFEGESDPGDQVALFALREDSGEVRGTYVVAFGPQMDSLDAAAVRRLRDGRAAARAARGAQPSDRG